MQTIIAHGANPSDIIRAWPVGTPVHFVFEPITTNDLVQLQPTGVIVVTATAVPDRASFEQLFKTIKEYRDSLTSIYDVIDVAYCLPETANFPVLQFRDGPVQKALFDDDGDPLPVDTGAPWDEEDPNYNLHPNAAGHPRIAQVYGEALERITGPWASPEDIARAYQGRKPKQDASPEGVVKTVHGLQVYRKPYSYDHYYDQEYRHLARNAKGDIFDPPKPDDPDEDIQQWPDPA